MKIAVYSKFLNEDYLPQLTGLLNKLCEKKIDFLLHASLKQLINSSNILPLSYFSSHEEISGQNIDFFVTIGGDGTFLDSLLFIKDLNIPVIGINTGRLGFLANNQIDELESVLDNLISNNFIIEERTLLQIESNNSIFQDEKFGLNDFTIHKRDDSSLTAISVYINGEFFNTYWGDGIIISTPTGSTAYSMSCGGPIVLPNSDTFVITPVAPHNLNVRPVIVPDNVEITFKISGRDRSYLISLDSRYEIIDQTFFISLKKAAFKLKTVRFVDQKFIKIIREKLNWGIDNRNI